MNDEETALFYLMRTGLLSEVQPLHSQAREKAKKMGVIKKIWEGYRRNELPVDYIRRYFGENVAIYFEWMRHYQSTPVL